MEFQVNTNNVILSQIDQVESGEYNVTECNFTFSSEFDGLTKKAVFTGEDGTAYLQTIVDNKCSIPSEILETSQVVQIGVYAYAVENEELILRYSPEPTDFFIHEGSYKEAQNSTPPTPSEVEQLQAQITSNKNDIEEIQGDVVDINQDIVDIKAEQITQNENIQTNANNISIINEQISDINETITNLETNKANVTDLNALTERVSTNERDIDTIDGHISDINQNIDDLEQDLTNYSLITETGSQINLNINSTNYQITAILKDKNGNVIYTSNAIDLPIESMIVNARYDNTTKEIVLTLQNGNTLRISVADLVSGLVSTDQLTQILSNYYNKNEVDALIPDLTDYVKNTDYATSTKGGVVKTNSYWGTAVNENGVLTGAERIYSTYQNAPNELLIAKGTLENVITGKELINQTQLEESQAIRDTEIEALQAENAELKQDITNMRKAMITVDGQGSDITLENTSENKFVELGLNGNTEQEQLTGKNLFDKDNAANVLNNIFISGDKFLKSGNKNTTIYIPCKGNTTYTIQKVVDNVFRAGTTQVAPEVNVTVDDYNNNPTGNVITLTTSNNAKYLVVFIQNQETSKSLQIILNSLQIEQGSTATSYEPYCGGIPSPNPDYPQQIKNVTGNANVKIYNKNLFNYDYASDYSNTTVSTYRFVKIADVKEGQNYIISNLDTSDIETETNLYIYISSAPLYSSLEGGNRLCYNTKKLDRTSINLNAPSSNSYYLGIYPTNITEATYNKILDKFRNAQLEQGSTATSYVPHQEQNYPFTFAEGQRGMQGTTLQDDGIHQKRKKKILDGTENFGIQNGCFTFNLDDINADVNNNKIVCKSNYYLGVVTNYRGSINNFEIAKARGATTQVAIKDNRFTTTADFKANLAELYANGIPVIVEYELAESELENNIIPYNETQQAQYDAIKEATSYDDITYISSESDELGFNMNVVAVADANKVIDNQNSEIDTIKSRLDLLEG